MLFSEEKLYDNEWVTIQRASKISALSITTLRRAINLGLLNASKPMGRILVKVSDLNKFLSGRK